MKQEKLTYNLAPGNILQNMYLKSRLRQLQGSKKTFIELGSGNGNISAILLNSGMSGIGFDLSETACDLNRKKNGSYIKDGMYQVEEADFFDYKGAKVDVIISSHVIEHFPDELLDQYFSKCESLLNRGGVIISLVPSSMKYWGIEDETVGHYRRFEFEYFEKIAIDNGFIVKNMSGLTYPLSNLLFGLSNYLINKNDGWKKSLSKDEQTELSSSGGARQIKFKTNFPYWFRTILNEFTMYPFYLLQLIFRKNKNSMVIYCEYQVS